MKGFLLVLLITCGAAGGQSLQTGGLSSPKAAGTPAAPLGSSSALNAPAYGGKQFIARVLQTTEQGVLAIIDNRRVMLTGFPDALGVADGTILKVRLRSGAPRLVSYVMVTGANATVEAYQVEGAPTVRTKPLR